MSQDTHASIDRYRRLLAEEKVDCLRERLKAVEERLWYEGDEPYFATELTTLQERGAADRQRLGATPPDLLLLTLGYSPEPILLAVAYHAPHQVLVLAERGLKEDYLARFERLWDRYRTMLGQPPFRELRREMRTVRDRPGDLFQEVRRVVEVQRRNANPRILLDITGAKKTMIAGAFLAAGYLDLDVSYVDFEDYDDLLRRPLPGTSRPGVLAHPLRVFRLREEERLAEAFDQRRYERAADLADSLQEMTRSDEVVKILGRVDASRQGKTFHALSRAAKAYALWANGFYRDAAEALEQAGLPLPPTVELLAKVWPSKDATHQDVVDVLREANVFANPSTALAYFLDVLVWNDEAMLARRPRDAYLRLYGAMESVFSYLFEAFVGRRPEVLEIDESRTTREDAIETLRKSSTAMLALLANGERRIQAEVTCRIARPFLEKVIYKRLSLGRFSDLRHKVVHWMAPVPRALVEDLKSLYGEALRQLVPMAVREFLDELGSEKGAELTAWQERMLAAAAGEIPAACPPLRFAELQARLRQEPV
jgi:hypothetical protein